MTNSIPDGETYHRAMKPRYSWWVDKEKRVSSAAFKDSKGLSVDRRCSRSLEDVTTFLKEHHPDGDGEIGIDHASCIEQNCTITHSEVEETSTTKGNIYHHVIVDKNGQSMTDSRTAKNLSKKCSHKVW